MLWDEEETQSTDENGEPTSQQETPEGYSVDEIIAHNNRITVLDVPTQRPLFCMPIDGAYWIDGRNGYLLSGTVESGSKELGDTIYLSNGMDGIIEEFDNDASIATPGDTLGILISGIKKGALDGVENLIAE
jgi:translation elongation factor EF-1alpha